MAAIDALPDGDVRRLRGRQDEWRLPVGDWRVRFVRIDQEHLIDVLAVSPRGSAYQA